MQLECCSFISVKQVVKAWVLSWPNWGPGLSLQYTFVSLSVHRSIYLSIYHLSMYLSIYLSIYHLLVSLFLLNGITKSHILRLGESAFVLMNFLQTYTSC